MRQNAVLCGHGLNLLSCLITGYKKENCTARLIRKRNSTFKSDPSKEEQKRW